MYFDIGNGSWEKGRCFEKEDWESWVKVIVTVSNVRAQAISTMKCQEPESSISRSLTLVVGA